jgi:hypothetical protein
VVAGTVVDALVSVKILRMVVVIRVIRVVELKVVLWESPEP